MASDDQLGALRDPSTEGLVRVGEALAGGAQGVEVESMQTDHHRAGPGPQVFLHHDFRQHNVLWEGDPLTGVVDWHDARVGPAASDVAYATVDLVRTNGIRAADLFVTTYGAAGGTLDDLPRWQALWLASRALVFKRVAETGRGGRGHGP